MSPAGKTGTAADRRLQRRIEVGLPLLVRGTDADGTRFEDTSHSYDVSRTGASFVTSRRLEVGMTVEIIIPRTIAGRASENDFVSQAQIVRVESGMEPRELRVGLRFIGPRFHRVFLSESTA